VAKRTYKAIGTKRTSKVHLHNPTKRHDYYLRHKPVNNQNKEKAAPTITENNHTHCSKAKQKMQQHHPSKHVEYVLSILDLFMLDIT
jgi:hypothetical protein